MTTKQCVEMEHGTSAKLGLDLLNGHSAAHVAPFQSISLSTTCDFYHAHGASHSCTPLDTVVRPVIHDVTCAYSFNLMAHNHLPSPLSSPHHLQFSCHADIFFHFLKCVLPSFTFTFLICLCTFNHTLLLEVPMYPNLSCHPHLSSPA